MKSTLTLADKSITYPAFRLFNDPDNSNNLFNGSIVLFPNANTMVVVHTADRSQLYKQGRMYVNGGTDDLFIPADDKMFQEAKGVLTLDFN